MKKIMSLFKRNYDGDRLVYDVVVPGAEWVTEGIGVATRKYDGTCTMIRAGRLYKRYDARAGRRTPPGFEPADAPDPISGHWPGWLPVGDGPEDRFHREALAAAGSLPDGTYELVGPKVQGNAERLEEHQLIRHGAEVLRDAPRDFAGLRTYLAGCDIEGVVWHAADGRMVKIKGKDFGLRRGQCR